MNPQIVLNFNLLPGAGGVAAAEAVSGLVTGELPVPSEALTMQAAAGVAGLPTPSEAIDAAAVTTALPSPLEALGMAAVTGGILPTPTEVAAAAAGVGGLPTPMGAQEGVSGAALQGLPAPMDAISTISGVGIGLPTPFIESAAVAERMPEPTDVGPADTAPGGTPEPDPSTYQDEKGAESRSKRRK